MAACAGVEAMAPASRTPSVPALVIRLEKERLGDGTVRDSGIWDAVSLIGK